MKRRTTHFLMILLIVLGISPSLYSQTQLQVDISNNGSSTIYYKKIGTVNNYNGVININGVLGAHTPSQGKSKVDLTFNARDKFMAMGHIDGKSPNCYIILVKNGSGPFGSDYDVYLRYGAWAQASITITGIGHCSTIDGQVSTENPGIAFWSSDDIVAGQTITTFIDDVIVKGGLTTNGIIKAPEIKVEAQTADFVFADNYQLKSLTDVEAYIKEHKHLPEIPSAKDMGASGVNLSEMNKLLLQKIEELTLYAIDKDKEVSTLKETVKNIEGSRSMEQKRSETLEKRLSKLESLVESITSK
ncbi:hypothetical protein [Plebeiibacterium sediminum]|uniref:ELKS/Rab6-interacting/CAST family protein n=1 Tax=Plebeiibacterium sediminum TaxID=2992112 RepID=A0AAE3M961_9BACT|nr:hypothetical protein [Plebeiobacterium sediminum]MCW3789219.1 ELKS/Rab6-interacting/CAST family protein [Plebeiobacterium sediminum]